MIPQRIHHYKILIFVFLFFIGGFELVYSAGQREDPILVARELIIQRKYTEAIDILSEVIRKEPDQIDEAEDLLRIIRGIRDVYNLLGQDLVDTLENDPENFERAVSLIDQMNQLDDNPNPRTRDQLNEARRTAKLQVDRTRRDAIFADALIEIQNERYSRALELYISGFELQRAEFYEDGYIPEIYSITEQVTQALEEDARTGVNLLDQWIRDITAFRDQVLGLGSNFEVLTILPQDLTWESRGSIDGILLEEKLPIIQLMNESTRFIQGLYDLANEIQEAQDLDPRLIDYLVFIQQFIRGLEGRSTEGIAGLLDDIWDTINLDVKTALELFSWQLVTQASQASTQGSHIQASEFAQRAVEIASLGIELYFAYRDIGYTGIVVPSDVEIDTLVLAAFAGMVTHTQSVYESEYLSLLREELTQSDQTFDTYRTNIETYRELEERSGIRFETLLDNRQEIEPYLSLAIFQERFDVDQYDSWVVTFQDRIAERNRENLNIVLQRYRTDNEELLAEIRNLNNQAESLIFGSPNEDGVILRYPDQSVVILDQAELLVNQSQQIQDDARGFLQNFPELSNEPIYQEGLVYLNSSMEQKDALFSRLDDLRIDARDRIAQSLLLRQQAQVFVNQARAATSNLNIDLARERFENARDAFFQALELLDDPAFRDQVDGVILALGDEIRAAQNELVVIQVRDLLTSGRSAYNLGDFNNALAIVIQAEDLWATTNTDPNQEVVTLKDRISSATTLSQERELSEFDPLFPTVSQFLNLARLEIDTGTRLFRQGDEERALERFSLAEGYLENILFVKPFNFEARILQIRITQVTQEGEFQELFTRRFEDTLSRMNTAPPIEVLTELQVLSEINPNYPGLQRNIQTIEIRLGLREDPLTRERIDESNRLLAQARNLSANTSDQATLIAALDFAERASILNRDNQQAQILADTLRIRLGGQASFALSSGDEQLFRRAEGLFVQGSIAEAYAIVLQLLQTRINQGYPPLISLRDRIERRL